MIVVDRVALAAAERVGKVLGARAGLAALRPLLDGLSHPKDRARCWALAFDHALTTSDTAALAELADGWRRQPPGAFFAVAARACRRATGRRHHGISAEVAAAEDARAPTSRSAYLRGRCEEAAGRPALPSYRRAALVGDADVGLWAAAAARLCRLAGPHPELEATRLARRVDVELVPPPMRLELLRARLGSTSRYGRVAALDGLLELAAGPDVGLARAAVVTGARHADSEGERLTEIEADRVKSLLALWPDPAGRHGARLALRGQGEGDPEQRQRLAATRRSLGGEREHADDALRALAESLAHAPETASALAVATLAASVLDRGRAPDAVGELVEALLAAPTPRAHRGWVALADALDGRGDHLLARRALAAGAALREDTAAARLADHERDVGWAAYEAGDGQVALAALRRARDLCGAGP